MRVYAFIFEPPGLWRKAHRHGTQHGQLYLIITVPGNATPINCLGNTSVNLGAHNVIVNVR